MLIALSANLEDSLSRKSRRRVTSVPRLGRSGAPVPTFAHIVAVEPLADPQDDVLAQQR